MKTLRPAIFLVISTLLAASGGCNTSPEARFRDIIAPHEIPDGPGGSVLIAGGDSVMFEHAFGLRSVESKEPITPSSDFRLASVTKEFTATCILILKERGALDLNQNLSDFFPDFAPVGDSITIHQLLCHTSGLVAYEDVMADTTTVPVLDIDVLHLVQGIDSTYFPPGTHYRYSNTGYALLALIVEKVSGHRFADFLMQEIFTPVGMEHTVAFEKGISEVPERVYGHARGESGGKYLLADQSTTSSVLGDGGIYSSVRDMARWHWSLEHPGIISEETLRTATSVQSTSDDGTTSYGYGWRLDAVDGEKVVYHTGSTRGFRNAFFRVPARRIAVIVLMNSDDAPAESIARELLEVTLDLN